MKKIIFSIMALTISFAMYSCKDNGGPENPVTVNLFSQLENTTAKLSTIDLPDEITGSYIDSVQIKKVRILISEVKFQPENASGASEDKLLNSGPLMFIADSTGNHFETTSGTIPAGTYSSLLFKIHRFESSELDQYSSKEGFKDFATQERYTVIIEGIAYNNGMGINYTYQGTPTVNMTCEFPNPIKFSKNEEANIYLMINPLDIFKTDNGVFDPTDDANHNDIDNLIKSAIKAIKK